MKRINCPDQFTPYSFPDEMYAQRRQAEFGVASSLWRFDITEWLFLHADNRDKVPIGFADNNADEREFINMRVPSVWQQAGFGEPTCLQYDSETADQQSNNGFFKRKMAAISSDYKDDDIGIYRARIDIPAHYLDRSVYLVLGGVCGRFEVYLNGTRIAASESVFTPRKFPLTGSLKAGQNILTLMVYRFESVSAGLGSFGDGTFGFSGIFRTASIVADSLIEVRSVFVRTEWTGPEHGTELGASAYLDVSTRLFNHTDIPVPVKVEYKLIAVFDEYDIYNLPEVRLRAQSSGEATVESLKSVSVGNRLLARGVFPWSHATPNLYDLIILLKDASGRIIVAQKRRIGFRTVREADRKVIVNDYPVPLKATRYFSFDPQDGLSVSPERMLQDIILMKQAHLNTVLMPHYPADPQFFDLCDRYGLYVICPLDKEDPAASVESFRTHPCLIAWSLKLDSREESMLDDLRRILENDSATPLFYWLFRDSGIVSDFDPFHPDTGSLFGEWQDICVDRRFRPVSIARSDSDLPADDPDDSGEADPEEILSGKNVEVHLDEATGETDKIVAYRPIEPELKFLHQADLSKGYRGAEVAIAQGLVDAFREKHPEYEAVRRRCQTVDFLVPEEDPSRPVILNTDLHGATGELDLEWRLLSGGHSVRSGRGSLRSLPPGGEIELSLGFQTADSDSTGENEPDRPCPMDGLPPDLLLNLRVFRVDPGPWSPIGYEAASCQAMIAKVSQSTEAPPSESPSAETMTADASEGKSSEADPGEVQAPDPCLSETEPADGQAPDSCLSEADKEPVLSSATLAVSVKEEGDELLITYGRAQATISKDHGGITRLSVDACPILEGRLEPFVYRAFTNPERFYVPLKVRPRLFSQKRTWRAIQGKIRLKKMERQTVGGSLIVCVHYKCPAFKGPITLEYGFHPDGRLTVSLSFLSRVKPPRYGLHLGVPPEADHFRWYGFGPGGLFEEESWSPYLGIYEAHSADLFHRYARPSENGAHPGTRVLEIVGPEESSLRIFRSDEPLFVFTATPYMPEQIDDCRHDEWLPKPERAELFLDYEYNNAKTLRSEIKSPSGLRRYRGTFVFEAGGSGKAGS